MQNTQSPNTDSPSPQRHDTPRREAQAESSIPTTLVGNVGTNPWVGETKGGHSMAAFNIATGTGETTRWYRVLSFGELAYEVAVQIRKGQKLRVDVDPGTARRSEYRSERTGTTHTSVSLRMTQVTVLLRAAPEALAASSGRVAAGGGPTIRQLENVVIRRTEVTQRRIVLGSVRQQQIAQRQRQLEAFSWIVGDGVIGQPKRLPALWIVGIRHPLR
jgi:single-stranded DNA-binding protein